MLVQQINAVNGRVGVFSVQTGNSYVAHDYLEGHRIYIYIYALEKGRTSQPPL